MSQERSKIGDEFFRYDDPLSEESTRLMLTTCFVVKITPCGYWLSYHPNAEAQKFTLHGRGKRWAYSTKEAALESYLKRKAYQRVHLENAKRRMEWGEQIALDMKAGRITRPKAGFLDFGDEFEKGDYR